jgi:hypothetical protein
VELRLAPVDIGFDEPALRGKMTPNSVRIQPVDIGFDFRANAQPSYSGPGAVVHGIVPPPLPQVDDYVITVVDRLGATHETLTPDFTVTSLRWERNGLGGATITGPITSPLLHPFFDAQGNWIDNRLIAIYRGANFIKTFVPSPRADQHVLDVDGAGRAYDLSRKFVGRNNQQPNLATNGSFDEGVVGWTENGSVDLVWSPTEGHAKPGAASVSASSSGDNFFSQNITVPDSPFETFVWIEGWAKVPATVGTTHLPGEELGIKVLASVSGTNVFIDGTQLDWTRVGAWQRVVLKVYIPANQTSQLQVQFMSPTVESVLWDDVYIRREERLYATGGPEDIIAALVIHSQNESIGKTNVGITFDGSNSSGEVALTRAYKYAERANILTAIQEVSQLNRSVDWHLEEPSLGDAIVTTYPRTGFDTGNMQTLEYGKNVNDFSWVWDTPRRADIVAYLGRGSGDLVNEAFANDPDTDVGWEKVVFATIEASIATQDAADGVLAVIKRARVLRLFCHRAWGDDGFPFDPIESCWIGDLLPCRRVNVKIQFGPIKVNEVCLIVACEGTPGPETLTVDCIPVSAIEEAESE